MLTIAMYGFYQYVYTHDEKKLLPKISFNGRFTDCSISFSEIYQQG